MPAAAACAGLQPCGLMRRAKAAAWRGPVASPFQSRPRLALPLRAAPERPGSEQASTSTSAADAEAKLERLEAAIRGKAPAQPAAASKKRVIPIKGMTNAVNKTDSQYENMAEWKEGQLFPEGWERMSAFQKAVEIYLGRRGMLFWAGRAAYVSAFGLLFAWVAFRFVGPALGLYTLQGDLMSPTML